jgi:hypothetical protein
LSRRIEENNEKNITITLSRRDPNQISLEQKSEALPLELTCSVDTVIKKNAYISLRFDMFHIPCIKYIKRPANALGFMDIIL